MCSILREDGAADVGEEQMLESILLDERIEGGGMVGAHAHDLGARGFELGKHLFRSRGSPSFRWR